MSCLSLGDLGKALGCAWCVYFGGKGRGRKKYLWSCVLIHHNPSLYSNLTKSESKSKAGDARVSTCLIAYCYTSGLGMLWGLQNYTKLFFVGADCSFFFFFKKNNVGNYGHQVCIFSHVSTYLLNLTFSS